MQGEKHLGPKLRVEQASADRSPTGGRWDVVWRVENLDEKPLRILGGRLPHSQFRCEEREFPRALELPPKGGAEVKFSVACDEAPGSTVENAFLILRVQWSEEPWRVFVRLRVLFDEQGRPESTTEAVTKHEIGFSVR
ncbi:MAG: hypothetical protein HYY46_08725 [Deltaproteobacteria bacterium]|nr:hypothetical protein [Deltaproteobacteria bacterium]